MKTEGIDNGLFRLINELYLPLNSYIRKVVLGKAHRCGNIFHPKTNDMYQQFEERLLDS